MVRRNDAEAPTLLTWLWQAIALAWGAQVALVLTTAAWFGVRLLAGRVARRRSRAVPAAAE